MTAALRTHFAKLRVGQDAAVVRGQRAGDLCIAHGARQVKRRGLRRRVAGAACSAAEASAIREPRAAWCSFGLFSQRPAADGARRRGTASSSRAQFTVSTQIGAPRMRGDSAATRRASEQQPLASSRGCLGKARPAGLPWALGQQLAGLRRDPALDVVEYA